MSTALSRKPLSAVIAALSGYMMRPYRAFHFEYGGPLQSYRIRRRWKRSSTLSIMACFSFSTKMLRYWAISVMCSSNKPSWTGRSATIAWCLLSWRFLPNILWYRLHLFDKTNIIGNTTNRSAGVIWIFDTRTTKYVNKNFKILHISERFPLLSKNFNKEF